MAARPLCRLHAEASGVCGQGLSSFGAIVGPFPFLDSPSISQQEILDHILAFAPRKWATAGATRYLTRDGFRTSFDFDDLIKRIAVRTVESRPASGHKRPHTDFLIVGAKLPFPVVHSQSENASARQMKYVVIGFVLVFVPGVLVALVWGFAHGVIP
jgi:hypothetical protein